MPAPSPRPRSRGQGGHADDLADLGAVDVDRLVRADGHRLAVLDRDHHHRAAGGDPLAQRRGPGARLGRGVQRHVADVGGAAGVGEGGRPRPAGSAAARGRRRPRGRGGRRPAAAARPGRRRPAAAAPRPSSPAARAAAAVSGERSGTHSSAAGRPASSCRATAARTSSAVTGPAPGARPGRVGPGGVADRDVEGAGGLDPRVRQRRGGEVALDAVEQPRAGRHTQNPRRGVRRPVAQRPDRGPRPPGRVTRTNAGGRPDGTMDAVTSETRSSVSPYAVFDRASWRALAAGSRLPLDEAELRGAGHPRRPDRPRRGRHRLPARWPSCSSLHVAASRRLWAAQSEFLGNTTAKVPFVIAVAGSVAVGKSTTARLLQTLLAAGAGLAARRPGDHRRLPACPTRCSRRAGCSAARASRRATTGGRCCASSPT